MYDNNIVEATVKRTCTCIFYVKARLKNHHHHTPKMCLYHEAGSLPCIHTKASISLSFSSHIVADC